MLGNRVERDALNDLLLTPLWWGERGQAASEGGETGPGECLRAGNGSGRQPGVVSREQEERDLPEEPDQRAHLGLSHSTLQQWRLEDGESSESERYDDLLQALYGVGLILEAALPLAQQADLKARLEQALSHLDELLGRCRTYVCQVQSF